MLPADELFEQFVQAYPSARRQRGYMITVLFLAALEKAGPLVLMNALAQHKRSEQWQNGMIPSMQKWLEEERWIQILPEKAAGPSRRYQGAANTDHKFRVPDHEPL